MKYSNEIKVGLAIVISTVLMILGVRYLDDMPLFRGSYSLVTEFQSVDGLVEGNAVKLNGVPIGAVTDVYINPDNNLIRVFMRIDKAIIIPFGSQTEFSGISTLASIVLNILPGPMSNEPLEDGDFIPSKESEDILGQLAARALPMVSNVDTLLQGLTGTVSKIDQMLENPESDLQTTIRNVQSLTASFDTLLKQERERLSAIMANVENATSSLNTIAGEGQDSLVLAARNLNQSLAQLDRTLLALESTSAQMDSLLLKINRGDGTLGLLVNDPSMYHRMDSAIFNLNKLLKNFDENPGEYLKHMNLIDLF